MDAFFASVEQRDNPQLLNKPVIVGGKPESRGVVAACSYEARRFGVHSAMPCAQAVRLCPQAIFTRPRMEKYREVSRHLMQLLQEYTDLVEPLSVDEAFLDVTQNHLGEPSATILAHAIRARIYRELNLTASAGVSFNKFLAKIASDLKKPNGLTTIPPEKANDFLDRLAIGKFFGVGKVTEKKMKRLGIHSGYDLRQWKEETLLFHFGKTGAFLYNCVRGIDHRKVESVRIRKSIGSETTFARDTDDLVEINAMLFSLAEKIEFSMQAKKCRGYTVTLKARYRDFTTVTRSKTARYPFRTASDILSTIQGLLNSTEVGRRKIRLIGLSVSKLDHDDKSPRQLLLPFSTYDQFF